MQEKTTLTQSDVVEAFARANISVDVMDYGDKFIIIGNEVISGSHLAVGILKTSNLNKVVTNFARELKNRRTKS